jgi:hypothetical protein
MSLHKPSNPHPVIMDLHEMSIPMSSGEGEGSVAWDLCGFRLYRRVTRSSRESLENVFSQVSGEGVE